MEEKRGRGRPKGYKMSEEARESIRKYRTGRQWSGEVKKKISDGMYRYFEERVEKE